jgi:hypothetical protein
MMRCKTIQAETMARPEAGRRHSDERKGREGERRGGKRGKKVKRPEARSEGLVGRRVSGERAPRVWNLGRKRNLRVAAIAMAMANPCSHVSRAKPGLRDPVHTGDHAYNACATLWPPSIGQHNVATPHFNVLT